MSVTIYYNPGCTKCRLTMELLNSHSIEPEIVEYLTKPPTEAELKNILSMLGISARGLLRTKESEYKELGLDDMSLSESDIIKAMIKTPRLIERPIVVKDGKAAIGRPPELILDIL